MSLESVVFCAYFVVPIDGARSFKRSSKITTRNLCYAIHSVVQISFHTCCCSGPFLVFVPCIPSHRWFYWSFLFALTSSDSLSEQSADLFEESCKGGSCAMWSINTNCRTGACSLPCENTQAARGNRSALSMAYVGYVSIGYQGWLLPLSPKGRT